MTCITNLHVGNGDVNYSIIDNEVEKDPVFGEAVIPSSGVKGALLSYVKKETEMDAKTRNEIFGHETKDGSQGGTYKFLSAGLLGRPVRVSKGEGAYALATTTEIQNSFHQLCRDLGSAQDLTEMKEENVTNRKGIEAVEGIEVGQAELPMFFGNEPWVILSSANMRSIRLPVVARNALNEKGESKNLWYEEFVPHKSVFYLIIITPNEENKLDEYINGKIVQFGANASIGYGLMKIERMRRNGNE